MQGVDYASVDENKPPDVLKARAAGVKFTYVRACEGTLRDPHMERDRHVWGRGPGNERIAGAFGAYLILYWGQHAPEPEEQARAFIGYYGARLNGELPPVLDVEFRNGREATGLTAQQALDRIERAYYTLRNYYGVVAVYTSARVWTEDLDGLPSAMGQVSPLWIKTPYVYKAGNKPHPEACPVPTEIPLPWRHELSPGVWIQQYQGDAKGYPGFSSTVDCNVFLPHNASDSWVKRRLAYYNMAELPQFQQMFNLLPDGIVGPATFSYLTA